MKEAFATGPDLSRIVSGASPKRRKLADDRNRASNARNQHSRHQLQRKNNQAMVLVHHFKDLGWQPGILRRSYEN
jgi:hypothetical protein